MLDRPWWENAVVYELYVRSFADSNQDGIGDLQGAYEKLGYLADLGVDAVWVTPFYPSGGVDAGYDVTDYVSVDSELGDLETFDKLVTRAHAHGMKIIIDVIPNHCSDRHPWFQAALAAPNSEMGARFLLVEGTKERAPNNWQSFFGGSAWSWSEGAQRWYCHLFDEGQPDFNWRNQEVISEFDNVLRFWLERGVDGFRIDVAHGLCKDPLLADDPVSASTAQLISEWQASASAPVHTWRSIDQDDTIDIYRHWRNVVEPYGERLLLGEISRRIPPARVAQYCQPGALHAAFNFRLLDQPWDATSFAQAISASVSAAHEAGIGPTWVLSNHDRIRHLTRYNERSDRARVAVGLLCALPGSVYLYQGEELGLPEALVAPENRRDPVWLRSQGREVGRDGCRIPLPWTENLQEDWGDTPWLALPDDWWHYAVEQQANEPRSMLSYYKELLACRKLYAVLPDANFTVDVQGDVLVCSAGNEVTGETVTVFAHFSDETITLERTQGDIVFSYGTYPTGTGDSTVTFYGPGVIWVVSPGE